MLPASCEEAFDMWLDPESVRLWMRPSDADLVYLDWHPIVGGSFRFDLREADGSLFIHTGNFLEIQRPHRLRFTWNSTVLGQHSSQVTVEFHEQAGGCLMILIHDLPDDHAIFQAHDNGWAVILNRFFDIQQINTP
jgi:uncharacterized protein YndB with AHSA1/START domain